MPKTYRVIVWGPGLAGTHAVKALLAHPSMQLVGLIVHSEAKDGKDAGELCGLPATGVIASRDVESVLALDADCVCYTVLEMGRAGEVVDDLCRILANGKNVVATTTSSAFFPALMSPTDADRIAKACIDGNTTLFVSGIHPGLTEPLALHLASTALQIDSLVISEILDAAGYADAAMMNILGFGITPEEDQQRDYMEDLVSFSWGPAVRFLADAMGVELDELRFRRTTALASRRLETLAGAIEPGTVAALHLLLEGIVDGQPLISQENIYFVDPKEYATIAADWPQPPGGAGYRVSLRGNPNMTIEFVISEENPSMTARTEALFSLTGGRMINALAAVCESPPGHKTHLELPSFVAPLSRAR